jgi:HD-GYP domain-containing protein (c-di-GMP phosphodiesterase class II)
MLIETQPSTAARNALIFGLAKLAESRDPETGAHLERICAFSFALAKGLQRRGGHDEVTDEWVGELRLAAALHDIGKVGIADSALLKPGPLTEAEREEIERHPQIAADTLLAIYQQMGEDTLIALSVQVALYHHEKWDGSGYPFKFKGEDIPLSARIVAVADVYDALTSKRVYKQAMSHETACEIINRDAGSHFDPAVVNAFNDVSEAFRRIKQSIQDANPRTLTSLIELSLDADD